MLILSPFPDPRGTLLLFPLVPLFSKVWPFICPLALHWAGFSQAQGGSTRYAMMSHRLPAWITSFRVCGKASGNVLGLLWLLWWGLEETPCPLAPAFARGVLQVCVLRRCVRVAQYTLQRGLVSCTCQPRPDTWSVWPSVPGSWLVSCFSFQPIERLIPLSWLSPLVRAGVFWVWEQVCIRSVLWEAAWGGWREGFAAQGHILGQS